MPDALTEFLNVFQQILQSFKHQLLSSTLLLKDCSLSLHYLTTL